jgi:hypothetical protein
MASARQDTAGTKETLPGINQTQTNARAKLVTTVSPISSVTTARKSTETHAA